MVYIASNPTENIRMNGTGIAYANTVGSTDPGKDLGEASTFEYNQSVTSEKVKTMRTADRADIIDRESGREATLNLNLIEMTEENLKMAMLGSSWQSSNQAAGNVSASSTAIVDDEYIDLGYKQVWRLKLTHGAIGGGGDTAWALGETVTGGTSGATAVIRYINSVGTLYILCNTLAVATFVVGETITTPDTDSATLTGVEVENDIIVGDDATPSNIGVLGTDYDLQSHSGFLRYLTAGSFTTPVFVWFQYDAVTQRYMYGLSESSVLRRIVFDTDESDEGPRQRWIFHKVKFNLNGTIPLLGSGVAGLQIQGSVLKDTTQPAGQEYFTVWDLEL